MISIFRASTVLAIGNLFFASAMAQNATFESKSLVPEKALHAAKAALDHCRKAGYQVAVAVVDKSGVTQVVLRDSLAGAHTIDGAQNKAWTAASFKMATEELGRETAPNKPMAGIRNIPKVLAIGGGQVIQGGGTILGAIGVSGAPGGEADDSCALAGIKSISDDIEF